MDINFVKLISIIIGAALVNNVVLSQFLGICPFLGVSKKVKSAIGMSLSVIFVMTLSSFITSNIYIYLLSNKKIYNGKLIYLKTIVFILIIACIVQFIEMLLKKFFTQIYEILGVYLPLITTNCAVLGVAEKNIINKNSVLTGTIYGFSVALGFSIAIIILAFIREKIEDNDKIPNAFKGMPIILIVSGIMSIAFCGFSGLI